MKPCGSCNQLSDDWGDGGRSWIVLWVLIPIGHMRPSPQACEVGTMADSGWEAVV